MSYSVCLDCKKMVYQYEKYCPKCETTKKPGSNDPMFWKSNSGKGFLEEPKRTEELRKDANAG